eukprot:gene9369-11030_t
MARSSGRSSSRAPAPAARSAPPPARSAPPPAHHAPAPAPAPHAPAPSSGGGGMLSGLGSTMAQGFAFGTGSALAREAVGSIFGGSSSSSSQPAPAAAAPAPVPTSAPSACEYDQRAFQSCLRENPNSASVCDHYFTALQACQGRQ